MEEKKYSDKKGFIRNIAFFGDADISTTDEIYTEVYKLAEILAKEGYVIVDGGGPGVMVSATWCAKIAGG